jgi:histidine ammonia-lyase
VQIDGNHLTVEDVVGVARHHLTVDLAPEARQRVIRAQHWVDDIVASKKAVYGINTGFGYFADRSIPFEDAASLSRNLILSHAVCTGP